ncbi:hypothetical protein LZ32DRAFT_86222 [Colletotrichum eremochloae]|nr:hypothetical protein LZ32DRAFT_86222 [Colletotrichum eremochloae]
MNGLTEKERKQINNEMNKCIIDMIWVPGRLGWAGLGWAVASELLPTLAGTPRRERNQWNRGHAAAPNASCSRKDHHTCLSALSMRLRGAVYSVPADNVQSYNGRRTKGRRVWDGLPPPILRRPLRCLHEFGHHSSGTMPLSSRAHRLALPRRIVFSASPRRCLIVISILISSSQIHRAHKGK